MLKAILLICVLAFVSQGVFSSNHDEVFQPDLEDLTENNVQNLPIGVGCDCVEGLCECCGKFEMSSIKLSQKGCLSLKYIGENTSFQLALKLGGREIVNKTISANDASKFCVSLPFPGMRLIAAMCFDLYDIQVMREKVQVCMRIVPRYLMTERPDSAIDMGCMEMKRDVDEKKD